MRRNYRAEGWAGIKRGVPERIRASDLRIIETIYRPDRGSQDPLSGKERVDATRYSVYPEE